MLGKRQSASVIAAILAVVGPAAMSFAAEAAEHMDPKEGAVIAGPDKGLVAALVTLVVFIGLLVILTKFAWGPIVAGLEKREKKIRDDLSNAEAALAKANSVLAQYNAQIAGGEAQVRELLSKATADAEKIRASLKAQAESEAAEIREKSKRDIQSERDAAVREIHEQAVLISTAVAEKILKRNINADDQRELVRSSLEQLGTVSRN